MAVSRVLSWPSRRLFSTTARRLEMLDVATLPDRIVPSYEQSPSSSLLSLHWPRPLRNVLIMTKLHAPEVAAAAVEFSRHLHATYPDLNLVFESRVAQAIHADLPFPIYTTSAGSEPGAAFPRAVDLVSTLGGDGTILRASSLFSLHASVPPILSFSMGTVGFLGEWRFEEHKRAFREVYMSGSDLAVRDLQTPHTQAAAAPPPADRRAPEETKEDEAAPAGGWESQRGKSTGPGRSSKILLRHRLKVGVYDSDGNNINSQLVPTSTAEPHHHLPGTSQAAFGPGFGRPPALSLPPSIHAMNELQIHRGPHPHLAIIDIYRNGHFLTEAIADGILISTPTGSTAYSLSSGGSIVHPLVKCLLITPICPRSLSFRPLVLPLNTKVVLKLSNKNRGRELEVSIDGKRKTNASIGMEIRVEGEAVGRTAGGGAWRGGVPCVIRSSGQGADGGRGQAVGGAEDDDGWMWGLTGLLKFNESFGQTKPE